MLGHLERLGYLLHGSLLLTLGFQGDIFTTMWRGIITSFPDQLPLSLRRLCVSFIRSCHSFSVLVVMLAASWFVFRGGFSWTGASWCLWRHSVPLNSATLSVSPFLDLSNFSRRRPFMVVSLLVTFGSLRKPSSLANRFRRCPGQASPPGLAPRTMECPHPCPRFRTLMSWTLELPLLRHPESDPTHSPASHVPVLINVEASVAQPGPLPVSVAISHCSRWRPNRVCSLSHPNPAARRPSCPPSSYSPQSRSSAPASCGHLHVLPPGPSPACCASVPSCLVYVPPSHGWATFHTMRPLIDAHLANQIMGGDPVDWLRGQGFSTCEVCHRVLSLRFNGRCFSCFHTLVSHPSHARPFMDRLSDTCSTSPDGTFP